MNYLKLQIKSKKNKRMKNLKLMFYNLQNKMMQFHNIMWENYFLKII